MGIQFALRRPGSLRICLRRDRAARSLADIAVVVMIYDTNKGYQYQAEKRLE
jgi:hypothetical protein